MTTLSTVIHRKPRKSTVRHKGENTLPTPHHHSFPVGCGVCVVEGRGSDGRPLHDHRPPQFGSVAA